MRNCNDGLAFIYSFELTIDSICIIIFVIMSEALLSDNQIDLIRNVIAKDKQQQLARTKESYRRLKKDRVKDILNNPSGIIDEKAKQNHKEAVKRIIYETFEDSIVTASYDQKIIGLCDKQMKEKSIEVRLTLSMLYRQDEMEEKLNDQEMIRSGQKNRLRTQSRKSLELLQESRKEEMLMSPSPLKERAESHSKNEESYPQSSAQVREISHSNQEESRSQDKVQQSSNFDLGKDSATIEQNEPISQQDVSFNSSLMNSPTFLAYNQSQYRLQANSSKQEKQFSYPHLSPPAIDSLQQNQSLQEANINLPEPRIEEFFENLQLNADVVSQTRLSEPIIEHLQEQEKVVSQPDVIREAESAQQTVKVESQIVEQSLRDIPVQLSALKPQNFEQSQPQSQDNFTYPSPAIQPKVEAVRYSAVQFPLLKEPLTEIIQISEFPDQTITFIYEIIPGSAEDVSAYVQISGIQGKEDDYEVIQ